jgi:hypothetical protein
MKHDTKDLGIWIDHSHAILSDCTTEPMTSISIASSFTHQDKVTGMKRNEASTHRKEQQEQASYYKEISKIIEDYDRVILFGPTDAKLELFNILKANHLMDRIEITVENADKMNLREQQIFIMKQFSQK